MAGISLSVPTMKADQIPMRVPHMIPMSAPAASSRRRSLLNPRSSIEPTASPRIMSVEDWMPVLPPIAMIMGTKKLRAMIWWSMNCFRIRLLTKPAKRVIMSQGRRALQACSAELYSNSDSFEPASLKISSEASSSITSMMSSTVIRPTRIPVGSRTGREVRSYLDAMRATSSWSVLVCTEIVSLTARVERGC